MDTSFDDASERRVMVESQLRRRGITDPRVLEVMGRLPRHLFVSHEFRERAYEDHALPIEMDQTISQPYIVALMTEILELQPDDIVLEIGTGSGYQAAVLAELAKQVYTIERYEGLAERAKMILKELGYQNIEVIVGDGTLGLPDKAPFDKIIVTAGAPDIPTALLDQLKEGGRLVIPVGRRFTQTLRAVRKENQKIIEEESIRCAFVPLVGIHGWARE